MLRPKIDPWYVNYTCAEEFGLPTSGYYMLLTHKLIQLEMMPLDILMNEIE